MLQCVHTIDLLYYKKMFWHHNEQANKTKEKDAQLSKEFVYSLVERAFSTVDEIFNTSDDYILDTISNELCDLGFSGHIMQYPELEVKTLREKTMKLGWDPRVKVAVKERTVGNAYQVLIYSMDLDRTIDDIKDSQLPAVFESPFTAQDIIDNPSAEDLNEWFRKAKGKN